MPALNKTPASALLTLGRLAKTSGLARASLLHYEQLGLLRPATRSAAGYRLYGEAELARLRSIRSYRQAGLSLQVIGELLAAPETRRIAQPAGLIEQRLLDLCREVEALRAQQKLLATLLATPEFRSVRRCRDKAAWVALLERAGFSETDMRQWHVGFESSQPEGHAAFLDSLGLPADEVAAIRRWSRAGGLKSSD